jgi:hypothetical protein
MAALRGTRVSAFGGKLWRFLTSLTLAAVLLALLAVLAVVGALVPQGMDKEFYAKAWTPDTYRCLSDVGLLNVYHSAVFLVPVALFALNLLCCSINILKRFIPEGVTGRNVVSALYHVALFAMLAGFVGTFLFAWGGEITFKAGEAVAVPCPRGDTKWAKLARGLGLTPPRTAAAPYRLRLERFDTTYVEKDGTIYVKDWLSALSVVEGGKVVAAKRIQVNDPLVYGGVKFYQSSFDQRIRFDVDGARAEVGIGEPLPLGKGAKMVAPVKRGTLLTPAGPRPLGPYVELKDMPADKWHRVTKDVRPGLKLTPGVPADVDGHRVTFVSYEESSGLLYKHDPAVKYLWVSWLGFTLLIAVRVFLQESLFLWFGKKPASA